MTIAYHSMYKVTIKRADGDVCLGTFFGRHLTGIYPVVRDKLPFSAVTVEGVHVVVPYETLVRGDGWLTFEELDE